MNRIMLLELACILNVVRLCFLKTNFSPSLLHKCSAQNSFVDSAPLTALTYSKTFDPRFGRKSELTVAWHADLFVERFLSLRNIAA